MLLSELHDELVAAASRPPLLRRAGARVAAAVCAALLAFLIAVPTTQARLPATLASAGAQVSQ